LLVQCSYLSGITRSGSALVSLMAHAHPNTGTVAEVSGPLPGIRGSTSGGGTKETPPDAPPMMAGIAGLQGQPYCYDI
jgi:hypothetical protein